MNKDRYNKIRLKLILKGLIPSFLCYLLPRKKNRIIFSSDHNRAYKHSSKFLFEYFIKEYPDLDVKFVINDEDLRVKLNNTIGNYFIESNSYKSIFYILMAKSWVVSSLETPVGGLFLNFRRNVYHLGHGAPLKNIGLTEKYTNVNKVIYYAIIRNNFSYFFSTSELFIDAWSRCLGVNRKKIEIMGQSRNDALFNYDSNLCDKINTLTPKGRNILYAPTWRPFSETEIFPFKDRDIKKLDKFLNDNNFNIFLRIHPNFESDLPKEVLSSNRIVVLSSNIVSEINDVLGYFDAVISDYSSIYIDFLLTKKPVLFLPYDIEKYEEKIGFTIPFEENTPGPKPDSQIKFQNEISNLLSDPDYYLEERELVCKRLNKYTYNNCKYNAEFILERLK